MSDTQSADRELVLLACTAEHQGTPSEPQHRAAILSGRRAPRCALGLLAGGLDGHGGAATSGRVIESAQRLFDQFSPGDPVERFFEDLVHEIHAVLQFEGVATGLEPQGTLAAVLFQPARIDWCHVGDSRVYRYRGPQLLSRTVDDSFSEQLIVEGRLPPEHSVNHPPGGLLTQALGGASRPHPNIGGMRDPQASDLLLLCSDGVWRQVSDDEIGEIIALHAPREAAEQLVAVARRRAADRVGHCALVLFRMAAVPA
jgi:PPM family protein phosphatase